MHTAVRENPTRARHVPTIASLGFSRVTNTIGLHRFYHTDYTITDDEFYDSRHDMHDTVKAVVLLN